MKKIWNFIWNNPYIRTLLLAIGILLALIMTTLWALGMYTQHGKAVVVPDVKGLQVSDAAPFFEKSALRYEVIDSSFIKNAAPGSIVEMTPQAGTKVKENRIIYLTINAFSTQMFIIPDIKDLSQRQAIAMLSAIGFEHINVEFIDGAYRDLVMGLKANGKEVNAGDKLPINSRLIILVSSGNDPIQADSVVIDTTPDESWF
ncbi:MAG: PASTA domain-containing protein [Dysgonamonadaceae bacterium]|jgi:beta-lactam-binding protein with PASTA domain|nr:PASTA domain-containing protein [Dysgonamonadaceae bacterium]